MPLVRFQVKNEYGLGDPELYRGAGRRDDPKAVLDGVGVAGLVGILRQLGDLAEFAADIFHDLHEQVMTTSARGRKLLTRVQHIEAAIPSLENAIQGQTSHIHFAYVAGSDWHTNLKIDQSHLLSSELPRFMLDSYEECRDPPRLYLLDKFDSGGTGSCLKRYSDPSYFKRVWTNSEQEKAEKVTREKKHMKNKRKGSRLRNGEVLSSITMSRHHSRIHFESPSSDRQSFSTENTSISDMRLIPQLVSSSTSFGSKTRMTVLEQVVDSNPPVPGEAEHEKLSAFKSQINQTVSSASVLPDDSNEDCSVADSHNDKLSVSQSQIEHSDSHSYVIPDDTNADGADSDCHHDSLPTSVPRSSSVTWDEKTEIVKPSSPESCAHILVDMVLDSEPLPETSEPLRVDLEIDELEGQGKEDILLHIPNAPISVSNGNHFNEVTSETENYMDALNTLESETETDSEYQTKREVRPLSIDHQESEYGTRNLQRMTSVDSESSDINIAVASPSSLNNVVAADSLNLASSASSGHAQSPHTTAFASESSEPIQSPLTTALSLNTSVGYGLANNVPCTMGVHSFGGFTIDLQPESRVSNLETVPVDETTGGSSKPSDTPVESSGKSSTKLWTNADLFGLEPSKPPDFSVSNKSNENGTSSSEITVDSLPSHAETSRLQYGVSSAKTNSGVLDSGDMLRNSTYMKKMDESTNTLSSVDHSSSNNDQICSTRQNFVQPSNPSDCFQSFHKNGHGDISVNPNSQEYVKTLSSSHLERIQDRKFDSNHPFNGIHDQQKVPDSCNIEPQPGVYGQNVKSISSSFSDLAQRFLVTSVPKKPSITRADISAPSGVMNDDVWKLQEASINNKTKEEINDGGSQISYGQIFKGKIDQGSFGKSVSSISCYSGNSSPPLEHMKISFHPMNGLETSKLKLEFPNGNLHESNEDYMFPSFQLLPPSVRPSQDCDSESDDDTFCRSCPYSSDDILSPHSYSNSEFWDHDERSVSKDNEIYDDSQRLSTSSASNSSFMGFEQRNHSNIDSASEFGKIDAKDDPSLQFGPVVDLPGLHSVISSKNQHEDQCDSLSNDCAKSRLPSTNELPPPPPLPPVQWRVLRSSFPSGEEHNSIAAESSEHFDKLQGQSFTATHQEEETAANHICNSEIMPLHIEKKTNVLLQHDQQELNGKREKSYVSNELELDAREELLQQIRNKHGQKKINILGEPKTNYDKEMEEREEFLQQIRNKHDQKKINGYSEVKTNDNKEPEEREELLHQIRNKSFNLRRTVAAKPTLLPQPATSVNVTAILEKANAIRQAFVGSDEGGDDDNWSDN